MSRVILSICLMTIVGCSSQGSSIDGTFMGLWASTGWMIHLDSNNDFQFDIEGHYSNRILTGTYTVNGDTIELLSPEINDAITRDIDTRFIKYGDDCIIGLNTGYDYCTGRVEDWCSRKWDLEEMIISQDCGELIE